MTSLTLALALLAQGPGPTEAELAANPLYREALERGLVVEGVTVKLPPPLLREGMAEADRKAAIKAAVDYPIDAFLDDSVNAPFRIRTKDVPYPGGVVHVVDLWFAIHASLDEVDTDDLAGKKDEGGSLEKQEVANMSFSGRTLTDAELKAHGRKAESGLDRYVTSRGVLLDKVDVASTVHVVGSKAAGALVIASKSDAAFDDDPTLANRWKLLARPGEAKKDLGPARPYEGSISYTRIGRATDEPAVLLVESHIAFVEPKAWFSGTSILRSKFGLIAQDQVRKLRRELIARRKKGAAKPGA